MPYEGVLKENTFDINIGFIKDPYRFVSRKLDRYHTNALETNLLFLKRAVLLRGEDGMRLFYDKDKFTRVGAMFGHIKKPLFGRGSIHGTDLEQHEKRKAMYIEMLKPQSITSFLPILENKWQRQIEKWEISESVVLLDEVSEILCRAICEWAGYDLPESEVKSFTLYNREMVESPGQFGPSHWYGRYSRIKAEKRIGQYIHKIRKGKITVSKETAAYRIAFYEESGKRLPLRQAAVSLLNVIRPTIAAARFVVFGALAIYKNPNYQDRLLDGDFQEWFAHEVRRYYPFVPGLIAKARKDFRWKDYEFKKGAYALIDIYGTLHDPDVWEEPEVFNPLRFKDQVPNPYTFIPQGGGEVEKNHRCPGEWLTIAIIKKTMYLLTQTIDYEVPSQNLEVEFNKIITQPKSGFIMSHIRRRDEVAVLH